MTTTAQDRPTRRNRRTVLVPLATVLVAGAVAVGSGATFTSTTNNTISAVTSGTLTHTNSKDNKAIFTLANLKPGDTLNGTVTITNTGSLPAAFSLTELTSTNNFSGANLGLTITEAGKSTPVYSGTFGGLQDGAKTDLGTYASNEARVYTFTVKLDTNTTNTDQSKTAGATYQWDSVQLDGTTINQ